MPISPEQLVARRSRLGASEMAAVMGVPSFVGQNAWTVWADKIGALGPSDSKPWMDEGNRLEPFLLNWAERELGELRRDVVVMDPECPYLGSTLDGQVVRNDEPVEGKTSGIFGPIHGEWGEEGTDCVPDSYLVQTHVQLRCTRAQVCHLYALLGGRGRVSYQIHPHKAIIGKIGDIAEDFWVNWIVTKRDPREGWAERLEAVHGVKLTADPCEPVLETAKRLRRVSGKVIELADPEPFLGWDRLRGARLEAEKAEKSALAVCLAELGDADAGQLPGGVVFTYAEQRTADIIDRDAMKTDGVYDKYATGNTCRVARLKGAKKQ